ncbi:ParB/RepB/Spo0J family partition protein [Erythrobacter aurantius]|uniref:ParB/RepB/Spo0J family partition protein n=1 Tax=Erythrobacter aurantius TaxID=2909249 RepID=UPI00207A31D4|nr:ParB/RepB/Spo0J family partition protein [Erythrobacter aurantius]
MSGTTNDPIRFSVPQRSAADRKKKLGKGLGALLGETKREEPLVRSAPETSGSAAENSQQTSDSPLKNLAVAAIEPLPGNPRKHFDETALDELAASIAARGVIQPVIVRPLGGGRYQLVAGERRWRAAQKARLHEIPALVRDLSEREVMALALIENLQREDLNPVEEARAYHRLSEEEGMTQAEIARMVEKSRSHVANIQRLLSLPSAVLDLVEAGRLSMGHARALIGQDDAADLARKAVNDNLSVREIEKLVRKLAKGVKADTTNAAGSTATITENADIVAVQNHLEEFLGLTVRIKADSDPRSGSVTIKYGTLDQLDLVCQRLTGGDI